MWCSTTPPKAVASGPTFAFAAWTNNVYYILEKDNVTIRRTIPAAGNTLNANHPVVRRMIVDSLRYWVSRDACRRLSVRSCFDPVARRAGQSVANPPVLWDIESDPVLAGTKLIAEAWDAAGLYQVGSFVGDAGRSGTAVFATMCGVFSKATDGTVSRGRPFVGSPDIYGTRSARPEQSINFVTCHDGFTLNDLVSYNDKHNEANGENNRDGTDDNLSWNCGVEGPPMIRSRALRNRQVKNFFTLLLSAGTPMLLMGDEVRRTQLGNNNAYCQDNEMSWFDWSLLESTATCIALCRSSTGFASGAMPCRKADAQSQRAAAPGAHRMAWGRDLNARTGATSRTPLPSLALPP